MSPVVNYERVVARRSKTGTCPACGKSVRRSARFEQTVNPWNRDETGTPKSRAQVRESVEAIANAWVPDFRHETCKEPAA